MPHGCRAALPPPTPLPHRHQVVGVLLLQEGAHLGDPVLQGKRGLGAAGWQLRGTAGRVTQGAGMGGLGCKEVLSQTSTKNAQNATARRHLLHTCSLAAQKVGSWAQGSSVPLRK